MKCMKKFDAPPTVDWLRAHKLLVLVLIALVTFIGYKMYVKNRWLNEQLANQDMAVANLYEAYTISNSKIVLDRGVHHVLCLGNSITLHTFGRTRPGASPFWEGRWGMCASRPDSDYVHRLGRLFMRVNRQSTIMGVNIADWENNPKCNKSSLFGKYMEGKDFIIIRLGENVKNDDVFTHELPHLISYCRKYTNNILITGMYWRNDKREQIIIKTAREYNIPYVPLYWIMTSYVDQVMFHVGDTIYNTKGRPYTIKTDFITTHPNDFGMKLIAEALWNKVEFAY